jgi:hypothetical protein
VATDNPSANKVASLRELIARRGVQRLYAPPFSPDFAFIEKVWAKNKELLRSAHPWLPEPLEPPASPAACTPDYLAAWFRRCGYE